MGNTISEFRGCFCFLPWRLAKRRLPRGGSRLGTERGAVREASKRQLPSGNQSVMAGSDTNRLCLRVLMQAGASRIL